MDQSELRPVLWLTPASELHVESGSDLPPGSVLDHTASISEAIERWNGSSWSSAFVDWSLLVAESAMETALARLRRELHFENLVVVATERDMEHAAAWVGHGASDFLVMPLRPTAVRACLLRLQSLRQAEQRAAAAERLAALGEQMAMLTHEGRSILQLMQANLEMLRTRIADCPGALDYQTRLQRAQDQLRRLFDDLRMGSAPLALRREWCDLGALLRQVAQRVARLTGRELQLVQGSPPAGLCCEVDLSRFDQVFRNLLENSLEASDEPVQVRIEWCETRFNGRTAVQIRLRDSGPGLTTEQRQNLFRPFFTTKSGGTGLGMAIARRIVEAHGGALTLSEHDAPGAEFLITLPLYSDAPRPLAAETGWAESAAILSEV